MHDITAFIRARLDDTERKARAAEASSGPEWVDDGTAVYVRDSNQPVCVGPWTGYIDDGDRQHIAEHDPARVLAHVHATRRMLDLFDTEDSHDTGALIDATLRLIAAPYNTHPDYRPEWHPED